MSIQIGDKVRFLNSVGGGVVRGFRGKDQVLVEDEDGFEVPALIKECVVVGGNDMQVHSSNRPKVQAPVETPSPKKPEPKEEKVEETPEGERLYAHVSAAMSQILAAEEELSDSTGLSHGSVSIGASETALNIYLLDRLKTFHMAYPGIRLRIYNHSTPQAINAVKNGMIDFAVVSTPAEVEAPLKMIKLGSFQEILVGGTTFTALGSQTLSLKELHNYPLIGLGRETMTFQFFNRLFMSHGLEFAPDTETATTDQILPLVKSELGLAFMPKPMAEAAIANREIVEIALEEEIPQRNICMVYDIHQPISAAARELKKVISDSHKV